MEKIGTEFDRVRGQMTNHVVVKLDIAIIPVCEQRRISHRAELSAKGNLRVACIKGIGGNTRQPGLRGKIAPRVRTGLSSGNAEPAKPELVQEISLASKQQVRGTDHYVSSKLVTSSQTVVFIYRLRQFGSTWKIIDILLDGSISQLNVYRSDFAATMKSGGAAALVKKINELSDKALKQ